MTKAEPVSQVAAETSTIRAAAGRMVGAVFSDTIADALALDEPVANAAFGKFALRSRAARQGRKPRPRGPIAVPALKTPSFKPVKALRDTVNE